MKTGFDQGFMNAWLAGGSVVAALTGKIDV